MTGHAKFSPNWFYAQRYSYPYIDIAVLKCPFGGSITFYFK